MGDVVGSAEGLGVGLFDVGIADGDNVGVVLGDNEGADDG